MAEEYLYAIANQPVLGLASSGIPIQLLKFSPKRAFGVEIELGNKITLEAVGTAVRSAAGKRQVLVSKNYAQDYDNAHWHVKLDHSCGDVAGDYGSEVASYKATSGMDDIQAICRVVEKLKESGANVNDRCGTHVHVEVKDYEWSHMAKFVANWIKMEPIISHMVPRHRADNKYCKFTRHDTWVRDYLRGGLEADYLWDRIRPRNFDNADRRKALNLCNFCRGEGRRTVEFRFPEATLDPVDMKNWVRFFLQMVQVSKKNKFPNDLQAFDLVGTLATCGLHSSSPFGVLSQGLRETKMWMLRRLIKYSRSETCVARANEILNNMTLTKRKETDGGD